MLAETWFAVVLGVILSLNIAIFCAILDMAAMIKRIENTLAADYGEED